MELFEKSLTAKMIRDYHHQSQSNLDSNETLFLCSTFRGTLVIKLTPSLLVETSY